MLVVVECLMFVCGLLLCVHCSLLSIACLVLLVGCSLCIVCGLLCEDFSLLCIVYFWYFSLVVFIARCSLLVACC